jgi:gluconate 2-dehydrogenase gamma chain
MSDMGRRGILKLLGSAPLAAGFALTEAQAQTAHERARKEAGKAGKTGPFTPKFFTTHEWATVGLLADMVLPRDARSGSATDALVPEFMDFIMNDPLADPREREKNQTKMRGGLAWLDRACAERFGKTFREAAEADRKALLDDIAYPARAKARPELGPGVAFFDSFRDLTASGFWSSKMGIEDLKFMGNTFNPGWNGASPEILRKLGLPEA